jgi:hypothetical protein
MRSILDMKDNEAITIANLAYDSPMKKPVVVRTKDETIDLIIVIDNIYGLEISEENIFVRQIGTQDWVEIDSGFNVKEKYNTCCNMIEIYSYLQSKMFGEKVELSVIDRMKELYINVG